MPKCQKLSFFFYCKPPLRTEGKCLLDNIMSPSRLFQHFILVIWNNLLIHSHPFQKFPEKLTHYYSHCKSPGSSSVDAFVHSDSYHAWQSQTHGDHQIFPNNQQKWFSLQLCQLAVDTISNSKLSPPPPFHLPAWILKGNSQGTQEALN